MANGNESAKYTYNANGALETDENSCIELVESFGCSFEEYQRIREFGVQPEVHVYNDR